MKGMEGKRKGKRKEERLWYSDRVEETEGLR